MAASYDSAIPSTRDHVRLLIGDTETSTAQLQDEEIDALITAETATGEALIYYAAARCLSILYARWAGKGAGVMEKQVSKLRIKRGIDQSSGDALDALINELRERGAWLLRSEPRSIHFFGG